MDNDVAGQVKVRFSKSLSKGEKAATASRKEKIKEALAELEIPYDSDSGPNIAVLGSGGGLRATIALCGILVELKDQNILDCIMYLSGVSGSAWCMSSFYKTENWAERLKEMEENQRESLVEGQFDFDAAAKAVLHAASDENYSLTDFWAYFVVYQVLKQLDETTLSEHRRSSESGKNPYPVYAAVNRNTFKEDIPGTWFEFTPHEVGIPSLGAYVDTKYFGSAFENGQMVDEKEEKNICYLQGLWGSVLGKKWEMANPIHGDTEGHDFSSEQTISLIDAGTAINTAYPLILHPERNVKLILSFDFSSGNPFLTIQQAAEHCEKHRIKFPEIDDINSQDIENPSGCYIFRGKDAPTIMHFPLFNKENCQDKISEYSKQYDTFRMKYSSEEIEKLLIAAKKNVVNAQQKIWEEIERAVAPSSRHA
ncbi:cytosolic phospholipase A2 gamma-like [Paroedura picta]|uniref:cytosolic phospholipase A2 gamma-like n=1 Tax=Paroedura picta TaxID=143630 RepID=UPI0040566FD1